MVSSCPEERKMFRITPMHYVIYDEAHMLKNMSTQRYDNLLKIKVSVKKSHTHTQYIFEYVTQKLNTHILVITFKKYT